MHQLYRDTVLSAPDVVPLSALEDILHKCNQKKRSLPGELATIVAVQGAQSKPADIIVASITTFRRVVVQIQGI